jgi:hypothetical protein
VDLGRVLSSLIYIQSVGILGRRISPSQGRYLHTEQYKYVQTSIPRVGFETTISLFERAKTVHALDRATAVIGNKTRRSLKLGRKRLVPSPWTEEGKEEDLRYRRYFEWKSQNLKKLYFVLYTNLFHDKQFLKNVMKLILCCM